MSLEKTLRQIKRAKFWRDRKVRIFFIICLVINLTAWAYIYFQMRKSGDIVPLRYNNLVGVNAIGHWTKLFSLPVYGIVIFALNFWPLYRAYERENKFLMHFLGISTAALQLILFLATILIVNL